MALNFPNSPVDGQVYTDTITGNRYIYDSGNTLWKYATTVLAGPLANNAANSANAYTVTVGAASNNYANLSFYTIANGTAAFDRANAAYGSANAAANSANIYGMVYANSVANNVNTTQYIYANGTANISNIYGMVYANGVANNVNITHWIYANSVANNVNITHWIYANSVANNVNTTQYIYANGVANNVNTTQYIYANGVANGVNTTAFVYSNGVANNVNTTQYIYANGVANGVNTTAFVYSNGVANNVNTTQYIYANSVANNVNITHWIYANSVANNVNTTQYIYANSVANSANAWANTKLANTTVTLAGSLTTVGPLVITPVGGQEGGEIQILGNTPNTNWTLDSYQNNYRIFAATGSTVSNVNMFHASTGTIRLGVNRADPGYTLDVSGQVNASGFLVNGSPIGSGAMDYAYVNTTANTVNTTAYIYSNGVANNVNTTQYIYANSRANSANAYAVIVGASSNTFANTKLSNTSGTFFAGNFFIPQGSVLGIGSSETTAPLTISQNGTVSVSLLNALIDADGSANSYLQVSIRNANTGTAVSTDFIATTDDGTDTTNFIDLGINGSGFSSPSWTINGRRDGYLYTIDSNLSIGSANSTSTIKFINFFVGGTLASDEVMRIQDSAGGANVGIGNTTPAVKLDVKGIIASDAFIENPANISTSYTITTGRNAMSAGPITIDAGITITVPSGSTWTIV